MRSRLILAFAITLGGPAMAAPPDGGLKLNQIQIVGTGESYKQAPSPGMLALIRMGGKKDEEKLDFGEPPLTTQLDDGARALSFDIAYDPKGGLFKSPAAAALADEVLDKDYTTAMAQPGIKVIHVADVDFKSSCLTLNACLTQVVDWSKAHPGHLPIVISLSCNEAKTPMPGATKPLAWDIAALAALDKEIAAAVPADDLITPDEVKADHASLREAVLAGGWPSLSASRGKLILVLNDPPEKTKLYEGKLLFVTGPESAPNTTFLSVDDPVAGAARITEAVKAGFMVITRADDETMEARANDTRRRAAAFASGAQVVLTNFLSPDPKIGPYQVAIGDPRHAKCDAMNADCAAWSAEAQQTAIAR
jgi:Phosphoinositide phospholipase C, Ca2+-dependent